MADIIGYPEQIATALVTKRATGAEITVTSVHNLPDGRVLVDAEIIEPPRAFPSFILQPTPAAIHAHKKWWMRLWSCVAPEPLDEILHPGEICRVWKHRHWFLHARSVIKGLAGLPVAIALSFLLRAVAEHLWWLQIILWFTPVLNIVQIGYKVLEWMADRIIVTDRRLILVAGVLNRRIQAIPLNRIRGIDITRTLVGRVFRYGEFKIGYPDYDLEKGALGLPGGRIEFVPSPKQIYHATGLAKSSSSP